MTRARLSVLLFLILSCVSGLAAAAGRITAHFGEALAESGGVQRELRRGSRVLEGDLLRVGGNSLLQLRMDDGALITLRSGTEFRIDTYRLAAPGQPGRALLRLLKGGLRTITGALGRFDRGEYAMLTPVATIGIRGTDFTTLLCNNDCLTRDNGLHARVTVGAILIRNHDGVELLLTEGEYAYVADARTPPERRDRPPSDMAIQMPEPDASSSLEVDGARRDLAFAGLQAATAPPAEGPGQAPSSEDPHGFSNRLLYGPPESAERFRPGGGTPIATAFAVPPAGDAQSRVGTTGETGLADDGGLLGFVATDAIYGLGTTQVQDSGRDPATGLRWGRWGGGEGNRDGVPLSLEEQSLHWVYALAPEQSAALPRSGTGSWSLVGNTNPTDDAGRVGFLGTATLTADFTNQTVDSSLQLGFGDGSVWQASGSGTITPDAPLFSGSYDRLSVDGQVGGSGSFGGFFLTDGSGGLPSGAGMGYRLDHGDRTVTGSAAFGAAQGGAP